MISKRTKAIIKIRLINFWYSIVRIWYKILNLDWLTIILIAVNLYLAYFVVAN